MSKEVEMRESSKESKDQEKSTLSHTAHDAHARLHACTRVELQQLAQHIPTPEEVLERSHAFLNFYDDIFLLQWYCGMCFSVWCDEFGNPIKNWGYTLWKWIQNRPLFNKLRDPDRIPDARKARKSDKPTNFLPSDESVQKSFGEVFK